jgi:hypothetical protein
MEIKKKLENLLDKSINENIDPNNYNGLRVLGRFILLFTNHIPKIG